MKQPRGLYMPRGGAGFAILTVAVALLAGGCAQQTVPPAVVRRDARAQALDEAWRFACSITNDAKDRARSIATVARAWLEAGQPERCVELAGKLEDWQRLAVLADAAAWWAEHGETNRATAVLAEAEYSAPALKDWPYDRVQMHLARAKALLGRRGDLLTLAGAYRENRDCRGLTQVALALESARRGAVDEAIAHLETLEGDTYFDLVVAQASGFREVAATGRLPRERTAAVYARAWRETADVPGWRKTDLQLELVASARASGFDTEARSWLGLATDEVLGTAYPPHIAAPRLAAAALQWAHLGDTGTIARLEQMYRETAATKIELIEQPAVVAGFAEAWALAGDTARAEALFREASGIAAGLLNARPRALAGVQVMLALARSGLDSRFLAIERNGVSAGLEGRGT